jgi:hypothetical protein
VRRSHGSPSRSPRGCSARTTAAKFRRQALEEILDIAREEANAIISQLYELRMVYKDKGDVKLTPTLHRLLREVP